MCWKVRHRAVVFGTAIVACAALAADNSEAFGGYSSLEDDYARARDTPSDINEHIPTLYEYATRCESVLELGVRTGVSTWAFLRGLRDNGRPKKILVSNDLDPLPRINDTTRAAAEAGVSYEFVRGNDLMLTFAPTDLTFIDTWHVYGQLKRELAKFAPLTRKYIVLHDTQVDGEYGESIRVGSDPKRQSLDTGIPHSEIVKGLKPAIDEFLAANPEWRIERVFTNNNGLTILARTLSSEPVAGSHLIT